MLGIRGLSGFLISDFRLDVLISDIRFPIGWLIVDVGRWVWFPGVQLVYALGRVIMRRERSIYTPGRVIYMLGRIIYSLGRIIYAM